MDRESDRAVSSSVDTLWELAALQRSFHPAMRDFAADAIALVPLPPSNAPKDLLARYDASKGVFTPPIKSPPLEVRPVSCPVRAVQLLGVCLCVSLAGFFMLS